MTTVRGWRGAIVIGYRDWFLTYYDSYQPTETSNATKHGFETIRSWEKKLNKTKTTTVSWISSLIDHSLVAFFSFFFFFLHEPEQCCNKYPILNKYHCVSRGRKKNISYGCKPSYILNLIDFLRFSLQTHDAENARRWKPAGDKHPRATP